MQNKTKALSSCQRAVAADSQNAVLHDNLGLSLFKFGKFAQSFKPFSQALTLEPGSAMIRGHIAESILAMKEFKMALNYYQEILSDTTVTPADRVVLLNGLYRAYLALGDYQSAYETIREANTLAGNSVFFGMVVRSFLKVHERAAFSVMAVFLLWFCHYFGQRVNRFLKNEV
jgi:tetratricopeptide (TPR) repeat protein